MEIIALLSATLRMATPLIYVAIGEVYSERAGTMNIGLEGLMLIGACAAYTVVFFTNSLILGIIGAVLITMVFGLAFAFMAVTVKANQIVIGAALNMVGLGVSGYVYRTVFANTGLVRPVQSFPALPVPFLANLPFIGPIFFNNNILVYLVFILVPLAGFVLNKTSLGLAIRAVGEHPRAVDTVGLPVYALRYGTILFGAAMAGLGGAYLSIAHANQFVEGMTAGRGFIALTMVPFSAWSIAGIFWGGLLFGAAYAVQLRLQAAKLAVAYQFLQILPYLLTLVVLVFVRNRAKQPKEMCVPYEVGA
jgi:general nucleoside transport system permease protein